MSDHPHFQETAQADAGDARAQARRALQEAYDWRDDEALHPAAERPHAPADERVGRDAARRARSSISRTVGV